VTLLKGIVDGEVVVKNHPTVILTTFESTTEDICQPVEFAHEEMKEVKGNEQTLLTFSLQLPSILVDLRSLPNCFVNGF